MVSRVEGTSPSLGTVASNSIKPYLPPNIAVDGPKIGLAIPLTGTTVQNAFTLDRLSKSGTERPQTTSQPGLLNAQTINTSTVNSNKAGTPTANLPSYINIAEVHDIAQRSGYVGLTDMAIQRAYQYGASLLTDIRV
jgi:hypothetical protein